MRRTDPAYFQGLNYVLNEQPDKAIDVFIKMAEVDSETVETHLALGNLFRRRGEVDRAIRVHQNLVARPNLEPEQRAQALLELGQDYMRAGLFDRAESLFGELAESDFYCEQSLKNLLVIYQQEKEWRRCLDVAETLSEKMGQPLKVEIAHFFCELAEVAKAKGETKEAAKLLNEALGADPSCVRASILQGDMAFAEGDFVAALRVYERVARQDPDYLGAVLPSVMECYRRVADADALATYLQGLYGESPDLATMLACTDVIAETRGNDAAADFLKAHLRNHNSLAAIVRWIELNRGNQSRGEETLELVKSLLQQMRDEQPGYICEHCGYTAQRLHWHCPGCKVWNSMKPLGELDTERR